MSEPASTLTPPRSSGVKPSHRKPDTGTSLSVCAITSLIFAIIALIFCWMPFVNNLAFVFAGLGVLFAIIGLIATRHTGRKHGRVFALTGLIIALAAGGVIIGLQASWSNTLDAITNNTTQSSTSGEKKEGKTVSMEGDIDSGNYHIRLVSVKKAGKDYEGKPTMILTYELTNRKNENSNPLDVNITVFQNGKELESAVLSDAPAGYDSDSSMKTLQPGGKATITQAYVLDGDGPVSVEASGTLDMSDMKVTGKFNL